jgi:hypothetical protein
MQRGKNTKILRKKGQATLNSCKSKVKQQQNTVIMYIMDLLNILYSFSLMELQALKKPPSLQKDHLQ